MCSSLIRMPGTAVAAGLYGPRISAGASGFRSQVSRWLGPPHSRMKMHDFPPGRDGFAGSMRAATVPGTPRVECTGAAELEQAAAGERGHGDLRRVYPSVPPVVRGDK